MSDKPMLVPAPQLAARNQAHVPGESPAYRAARNALLIEEIELRRHLERVAAQRRALPAGGAVPAIIPEPMSLAPMPTSPASVYSCAAMAPCGTSTAAK
jgi:hypothetical protein